MRQIQMTIFNKPLGTKGNWHVYHVVDNEVDIYRSLANDLIAKKICGCTYISRITRWNNYDGTETIKVYYDNSVMREYIIESH